MLCMPQRWAISVALDDHAERVPSRGTTLMYNELDASDPASSTDVLLLSLTSWEQTVSVQQGHQPGIGS